MNDPSTSGKNGVRATFWSPYDQYKHRNGERFEIVRAIVEPDATHDAEVLPMYVIRFEAGDEIEAWPEEVANIFATGPR